MMKRKNENWDILQRIHLPIATEFSVLNAHVLTNVISQLLATGRPQIVLLYKNNWLKPFGLFLLLKFIF